MTSKLADILSAMAESSDMKTMSGRVKEAAKVCEALLDMQAAMEKAILAMVSACQDVACHLDIDVRDSVLMVESFMEDVIMSAAMKEAVANIPIVPFHVHHVQPSTSRDRGCQRYQRSTLLTGVIVVRQAAEGVQARQVE